MFGISGFAQSPYATLGTSNYAVSVLEALSLLDASTGGRAYADSVTENINLLAATVVFAWVKIDNTEVTIWTLVNNGQLGASWSSVDNQQTAVWTPIDNRQ